MDPNRLTEKGQEALREAQSLAQRQGHSQIDAEHLAVALLSQDGGVASRMVEKAGASPSALLQRLRQGPAQTPPGAAGLTREKLLEAAAAVRGGQRITSPNPEGTYEALDKYGRDLTALAQQGKLDPVIGRDEEIRRVIQILSRRTKNNPVLIGP